MSLQAKTFLNLLAGGLAGILAWTLTDLTGWFTDIFQPHRMVVSGLFRDPKYLLYGALFGLLLGLMLAVVDSLSLESKRRLVRTLALGAGIGAVGGWVGLSLGQSVFGAIVGNGSEEITSPGRFFVLLFARALGWCLIGGTVGAAQGVVSRSPLVARQGAFGGLIGGFLGGTAFEVLNGLEFPAPLSRLIALVAVGALAGFFVGIVQNLFKQAWIRVVLGKNEGKEYLISKPITTVGRGELSDIGLYGDPSIAPTHIVIESLAAQNRHRLRFIGEGGKRGTIYAPPLVNGQPVANEMWLADGDAIQLGRRTLLFHEKATRRHSPPAPNPGRVGKEGAASGAPTRLAPPSGAVAPGLGAGGASPRYVGQELSGASAVPARPPLTTPDEIVAQMGAAPVGDAAVLSPGMSGAGMSIPSMSGAGMGGAGTRLVCVQGPYAGQSFPLSHAPATIGRAPDQTIPLPADTSISRLHARITYADGRHLLADGGSSNGTFVNGSRVADARPLSSGDTILLGDTALRYE